MRILVIAKLQASQLKYKLEPLSAAENVEEILLIRKFMGPDIPKLSYIILPSLAKYKFFYSFLAPFYAIYYAIKFKPDFILSYHFFPHAIVAFIASLASSRPFIYSQIDLDIQDYLKHKYLHPLIMPVIRKARNVNVPGSNSKNYWIKKGIPADRINLLHSTINVTRDYFPVEQEKKYDLVYVGSLEKRKQVDLIIKALHILKKDGLFPVFATTGEGFDIENLKQLVKDFQLEKQVIFLGSRKDVSNLLHSSRIFIITSRNEGIPCALMEAMACELYAISTDAADIKDVVINNQTGTLLKGFDEKEIAEEIKKVLLNYDSLLPIRKNARQHIIKNHSYESATVKWNKVIPKLFNK
jgi:glycosyltransferase involved in cell wall biosynthesis